MALLGLDSDAESPTPCVYPVTPRPDAGPRSRTATRLPNGMWMSLLPTSAACGWWSMPPPAPWPSGSTMTSSAPCSPTPTRASSPSASRVPRFYLHVHSLHHISQCSFGHIPLPRLQPNASANSGRADRVPLTRARGVVWRSDSARSRRVCSSGSPHQFCA
jgi:hypothetical protein